jgi:hypothetical protein
MSKRQIWGLFDRAQDELHNRAMWIPAKQVSSKTFVEWQIIGAPLIVLQKCREVKT